MENFTSHNVEFVGYHDLNKKPGFKMGMKVVDGQWYLYIGHLWHAGWSILNVTDPQNPQLVKFIDGPENTFTLNIQIADNYMITGLEPVFSDWGATGAPAQEGLLIWDISDPINPRQLSHWKTGHKGTHRNYYDGGRYVHVATTGKGYEGYFYLILDIIDPEKPVEVGRWFLPEQFSAGGGTPRYMPFYGMHDPYIDGDRAYLAFGRAGMVVLDISDITMPKMIGHADLGTLFASIIGVHTAMPVNGRNIALISTESIEEECNEPLNFAGIVDISDKTKPKIISLFPTPEPPEGAQYKNFSKKGGRFGPHNFHHYQNNPDLLNDENHAYLTYFNAGLRVYDTSDPYLPKEVGFFLPDDPKEKLGVKPSVLVTQSEDVLVDSRGYAYLMDKNHGMYIVRYTGK